MKIMGMSGWVHWVAWFMEISLVMSVPVVLITLVMGLGGIFTYSDMGVIFVYIGECLVELNLVKSYFRAEIFQIHSYSNPPLCSILCTFLNLLLVHGQCFLH